MGMALMPRLKEFSPPKLLPQLLPKLLLSLPSMASDITFIMVSIMRNIRPNMSSNACAVDGSGALRAQIRTSMERLFLIT
jgi:hypothetical protein